MCDTVTPPIASELSATGALAVHCKYDVSPQARDGHVHVEATLIRPFFIPHISLDHGWAL